MNHCQRGDGKDAGGRRKGGGGGWSSESPWGAWAGDEIPCFPLWGPCAIGAVNVNWS